MSKVRHPVILTTTSDHLSRAAEAILRRFPSTDRPEKNAILNDIAAALRPGKNWGGLLDAHREGHQTVTSDGQSEFPNALRALEKVAQHKPDKTVVIGAVDRRLSNAGGVVDTCFIGASGGLGALEIDSDGGVLVGIVVDIIEQMSGYEVQPVPSLLIVKDDRLIKIDYNRIDATPATAQLVFQVLQEVWFTDWSELLHAEGISIGQVIVGPIRGAAVITRETREAVNHGQNIHHHQAGAVRFVLPDDIDAAMDLALLSRLTEITLATGMTSRLRSWPRIDIAGLHPRLGVWNPIEGLPAELPYEDLVLTPSGKGWLSVSDDPTMTGRNLAHLLGEALAFAMDFHGVSYQEGLFIEATARERSPQDKERLFADNWRLVAWRGDQAGEWRLSDANENLLFRRRVEAWLKSEKADLRPRPWMPEDAVTVLTSRSMHRNTRHWDRAVGIFREIS